MFEKYCNKASELENDYEFMSLEEVENFVKKHKHLPNVTSVNDVKEKGGIVVNKSA